jgi:nucleotide-binding universal stress UspA family protein
MDTKRTGGRRLRRVLFATDRSASSRAALLAVAGLAVGGGTEVVVLHVDDHRRARESDELAGEVACGLIALAVDARPEVRAAPRSGVAAAIAAAAEEHGADLVVLGSRGRSDLGGLLLGSVGHEVLARVTCPVLLVRAGRRATGRRRRLLLAVAGDEDLDDLVRTTAAIAEHDSQVLVLHLLEPGQSDLQLALSEQLVERAVAGLRRCGVRARGRVRARAPGRESAGEIARTALGYGADLIVMGSRRLPALTALLRGSVSHGVMRASGIPVLVGAADHRAKEEQPWRAPGARR